MNQLPICIQWVQALGFPVVGSVLAIVGAWLALQQFRLARVKLQHDLYDRRYAVFKAAQDFLLSAFHSSAPSSDAMRDFAIGASQSVFLFDDEMASYLRGISDRMEQMRIHHKLMTDATDPAEREKQGAKWLADREWMQKEFTVLVERFKPFLRLDQRK